MPRSVPFLLAGWLVLGLAGCSISHTSGPFPGNTPLRGVRWNLERIEAPDGRTFSPEDDEHYHTYFVRFAAEGDSLSAESACNRCAGTYAVEHRQAMTIRTSCTEAACDVNDENLVYGALLGHVTRYEIENDRLRLYAERSGGTTVLYHRAAE